MATIISGVASGISAIGSLQAGAAAESVAKYNAQVEEQRATEATGEAVAQEGQIAIQNRRQQAATVAAFGASGVDANSGTPLSVMADQAMQGELSKQLTLYRGTTQAMADRQQGNLDIAQGNQAVTASYYKAGSTLLSGGAQVAGPNGANILPGY